MSTWVIRFDEEGSYLLDEKGKKTTLLDKAFRFDHFNMAEAKAEELFPTTHWGASCSILNIAIHEENCSFEWGCKYGEHDCPVARGVIPAKSKKSILEEGPSIETYVKTVEELLKEIKTTSMAYDNVKLFKMIDYLEKMNKRFVPKK